ncbi:hypothetical protein FRC03_010313 [Tulasnella sp. 419]|nr:hypothetical protein FRC03_010313 [Tulasnella sp. 419]
MMHQRTIPTVADGSLPSSSSQVRDKAELTQMFDFGDSQPSSKTHPIRLSEYAPFNDDKDNLQPHEIAYNDLTFVTSRIHSKLAVKLESLVDSTFEKCSWALGVQPQAPVNPGNSAIVIMNAGEGIGRSLSLKFAETGYTVFALVHPGRESAAEGSISKLMYIWQHIRAVLLSRRGEVIRQSTLDQPYVRPPTFTPLGDVIPIPFSPNSPKSRIILKQQVQGYCKQRGLHLRVVLMTPSYSSRFGHGEYLDIDLQTESVSRNDIFAGRNSAVPRQFSSTEDGRPTTLAEGRNDAVSTSIRTEMRGRFESIEGYRDISYMAVTSVDQYVLERTIQRDVTEQVLVAQSLAELLITHEDTTKKSYSARRKASTLTQAFTPNLWHKSHETDPYCRPPMDDNEGSESDWYNDDEPDVPESGWVWSILNFVKDRFKERYLSTPPPNFAGRIIWLIGAGEASFGGGQGITTPVDAAREAAARIMSNELSPLGIQVSVVRTGPLESRSCAVANQEWKAPPLDVRANVDNKPDAKLINRLVIQMNQAKLLARISSLWALKDENCFWVIKQAAEAQYPRSHYTLGLDVMAEHIAAMAPDTVKQLTNWFIYERLAGKAIEAWLMKDRSIYRSRLIQNPLTDLGMWIIGKVASVVRGNEEERNEALEYQGQRFPF